MSTLGARYCTVQVANLENTVWSLLRMVSIASGGGMGFGDSLGVIIEQELGAVEGFLVELPPLSSP